MFKWQNAMGQKPFWKYFSIFTPRGIFPSSIWILPKGKSLMHSKIEMQLNKAFGPIVSKFVVETVQYRRGGRSEKFRGGH